MKREDGCAVFSFFYKKMSVKHKKSRERKLDLNIFI